MGALTRNVVKAVGMLSGVQLISVVSAVVRVKFVALVLGPAGIGLVGIFQTALDMLSTLAQMGLGVSGTREVAVSEAPTAQSRAVALVKAWGWRLALLGLLVTLLASPWLSLWSFDSVAHAGSFMILGAGVAFAVGGAIISAVMRGTRSYASLARGTIVGAVGSVVVFVPLILGLNERGVAPAVVAAAAVTLAGMWMASRRDKTLRALPPLEHPLSRGDINAAGGRLIKLGWWVTLAYAVGDLSNYALLSFINRVADVAEVGYFQAGYTLLVRYTGFIFGALAVEYFPRVSGAHASARRLSVYASHEVSLLMWVFVPVSTAFVAAAPLIVRLLYTDGFEVILPYLYTGAAGAVLRCLSISLSYLVLAKGDGPKFLLTEGLSALAFVGAGMAFYSQWGLDGMGVAYVTAFIFDILLLLLITRRSYGVSVSRAALSLCAGAFLTVAGCGAIAMLVPQYWLGNILSAVVALAVGGVALTRLFSANKPSKLKL